MSNQVSTLSPCESESILYKMNGPINMCLYSIRVVA
jgi:hypothetical protein